MTMLTTSFLFILALTDSFASATPAVRALATQIPINKRVQRLSKRQGVQTGAVGLGDLTDGAYSIQVTIGSTTVPVVLDTGSSDLWSITTDCTAQNCGASFNTTPQLSPSSLQSTNIPVKFFYGDSAHETFASGVIGSSSVSVASLILNGQFLAACDQTNTNLSGAGLSGIFGIGFPNPFSGSVIFASLFKQKIVDVNTTDTFISSLPSQGPFMSRLVANGQLKEPMFTVTLQRDDVEIGGNVGQLTIGSLPDGVSNDSLTWVPVRLYTPAQGGLLGSTDNPNEVYPIRWEVPLDDVMLDGQTLPKPQLADGVGYTALIDTGTSGLRGPQNTVASVYSALATGGTFASGNVSIPPAISCSSPVHLSFVIGGKTFPVDPRDFLAQQDIKHCDASTLFPTDPPSNRSLLSWILGDPFMKSNLVAFYMGNLTHPSVDPPRIGLLSTVPSNADALLQGDISVAQSMGSFIASSVTAPLATFSAASTDANGVAQALTAAPMGTPTGSPKNSQHGNGASLVRIPTGVVVIIMIALSFYAL